jgi:cytochrome c553
MPPFRKTEISDDDLAALAAYLARRRSPRPQNCTIEQIKNDS